MANEDLDAIERSIQQAKAYVESGNALKKLKDNREFKKVILEGYFKEEAVRLVHLKADVSLQSPVMQESINKQIDAIGAFSQYLNTVLYKADMALKTIEADEAERDEILSDEGNE